MENPYAAHDLTPELVEEERRRPKLWLGFLNAYAVHHLMSLLGLLAGLIIRPGEWSAFFPTDNPLKAMETLVFVPFLDLYLVLEPLFAGHIYAESFMVFRWLRAATICSIPVAGMTYAISRRRIALWFVGIVSFVLFFSFVLTYAINRRAMGQ